MRQFRTELCALFETSYTYSSLFYYRSDPDEFQRRMKHLRDLQSQKVVIHSCKGLIKIST